MEFGSIVTVLNRIVEALNNLDIKNFDVYTDATRPAANTKLVGYTFFNTSDNFLNTSDGANWRDQAGAIT